MNILKKVFVNYKSQGLKKTLIKIILRFFNIIFLKSYKKNKLIKKILSQKTLEDRFDTLYSSNYWSDTESKSGSGSSLESTKNIRIHLPLIIKKFNIKSVFDAPCGDLNWMSLVLKDIDIDYHGSDIVEKLIISNNKKFGNKKIIFSKKNIIYDKLPNCDLMICRDCLFHFSYSDIFLFFNNFISSNIKYLLTTSHLNKKYTFINTNIITGDYRLLDFFSEPFNLEKKYTYSFDDRDRLEIKNFKQMYLFSKEELENSMKKLKPQKFLAEDL